ncbi:MAG TPA: hypothetical protein VGQ93_12340 [Lysobacter sp.]|jgi:hypothetical protein|nr:hypothetical protein [Lysobacter sp.]
MFERMMLGLALALIAMPSTALTQTSYVNIEQRLTAEQRHEAGLDTLSSAQLSALNRMLREESTPTVNAVVPSAAGAPRPASFIGLDDKPIHSRLKGSVSGWEPGTVFELENGQQWKVLKGNLQLRKTLQAPEIVVVPGVAGRWFLQVDEDLPKARVYRID